LAQDEESGLLGSEAGSGGGVGAVISSDAAMNTLRSIVVGAALLTLPAEAQDHRFETDPVATVRENFVACDGPAPPMQASPRKAALLPSRSRIGSVC
jgi:hypothetical protein